MFDLRTSQKNNEHFYDELFVLLIISLIIFKFNDLSLPYFWDELGVYSQAADYQSKHTISLMPNSVEEDISRGHPLLFTFLNAVPLRIFGSSVFVAHTCNLCVAILFLVVFYLKITAHFNRLSAFSAVTLLAVQPVFLAQSALVIPETILSMFAFLALIFFYEGKYYLYIIFGSLVVLTKESGLVVPAAALSYFLLKIIISREQRNKFSALKLSVILVPFLVFGIFLLIQKQQMGWYFFPYHYDNIVVNFETIRSQFLDFFDFVFWSQGRYWWLKIILIASIFASLFNRLNWEGFKKSLVPLLVIFMFGFLLFSSLSFYMERYVLVVVVMAALLTGVSLELIFRNKFWVLTATALLCIVAFQHLETNKFNNDCDLGYRREVRTLQSAINYVSDLPGKKKKVYGIFPVYFALNFPNGGYMNGKNIEPETGMTNDLDYIITSHLGLGNERNTSDFQLQKIKTFAEGCSTAEVFEVIKQ